jgi:hypothetical protein
VQPESGFVPVQASAVYPAGATPVEALKVALMTPAVVEDEETMG